MPRQWPIGFLLLCLIHAFAAEPAQAQATASPISVLSAIGATLSDDSIEREVRKHEFYKWEAEMRPDFQQLLYVELAFLRQACAPDARSFAVVAKSAAAGLGVPLREFVVEVYGHANVVPDAQAVVQKSLLRLAKENLGPEKVQIYVQERDKRSEARKHAVVMNLVAVLDERLDLSSEQRIEMVQSLSAHYEKYWDHYFQANGDDPEHLPTFNIESLVALLDKRQKRIWERIEEHSANNNSTWKVNRDFLGEAAEIEEIKQIIEEGQGD